MNGFPGYADCEQKTRFPVRVVVFHSTSITKDDIGPFSDNGEQKHITTTETHFLAC